ncbi:MAG: hypothetical protein ACLPKB_11515 [Xanthobacteraceae bacterium]
MTRLIRTALGSTVALALITVAERGFAEESGDFNATLRGATIGEPVAAAPPPGIYADLLSFSGVDGKGQGQNNGLTVYGQALSPAVIFSPGWKFLGGSYVASVVQPFFVVAGFPSGPSGAGPLEFQNASFFENMHNTIFTQKLAWNLGQGWFFSAGVNFQGPDGSTYNGTLNQDYWTVSPRAAIAYLDKDWKFAVNGYYDIHSASEGHTGTYAALASAGLLPAVLANQIGDGFVSGQQLFIDWTLTHKFGKWEVGPVGYFKFQTTADSPGGTWTCAQLVTAGLPTCGHDTDIALGGLVGYDFGPVDLQAYVTKSVYTRDDFGTGGLSAWFRTSFKIWGPDAPPARPMYTK